MKCYKVITSNPMIESVVTVLCYGLEVVNGALVFRSRYNGDPVKVLAPGAWITVEDISGDDEEAPRSKLADAVGQYFDRLGSSSTCGASAT